MSILTLSNPIVRTLFLIAAGVVIANIVLNVAVVPIYLIVLVTGVNHAIFPVVVTVLLCFLPCFKGINNIGLGIGAIIGLIATWIASGVVGDSILDRMEANYLPTAPSREIQRPSSPINAVVFYGEPSRPGACMDWCITVLSATDVPFTFFTQANQQNTTFEKVAASFCNAPENPDYAIVKLETADACLRRTQFEGKPPAGLHFDLRNSGNNLRTPDGDVYIDRARASHVTEAAETPVAIWESADLHRSLVPLWAGPYFDLQRGNRSRRVGAFIDNGAFVDAVLSTVLPR